MILNTLQRFNQIVIALEIVFFNLFGLFGNFNFIVLIVKNVKLRSKSSYLQCTLCFCHIICLLFELFNASLAVTGLPLKRNECFPIISPYIFFVCAQAVIILMMTVDLFIILFFPTIHRTCGTWKYMLGMLLIPSIYAFLTVTWGFRKMNEEVVLFCNPPLGLHPLVSRFWLRSSIFINTITLALFIILILVFRYKGKTQNSHTRKVMQRLKVSILLFIFTWYTSSLAGDLFVGFGFTGETLMFMQSNLVIFVLISYSQFFYVVIWRSSEYRMAFLKAWSWIWCCSNFKSKFPIAPRIFGNVPSQ